MGFIQFLITKLFEDHLCLLRQGSFEYESTSEQADPAMLRSPLERGRLTTHLRGQPPGPTVLCNKVSEKVSVWME